MLKNSTSVVLTSLRGSTYRSVRLAASLVAALLEGLFEHPDVIEALASSEIVQRRFMYKLGFPQPVKEASSMAVAAGGDWLYFCSSLNDDGQATH